MKRAKGVLRKLFYPPKGVLYVLPPAAFTALIFIFALEKQESMMAYAVFLVSAYGLSILIAASPRAFRRIKSFVADSRAVKKLYSTRLGKRYFTDMFFRGGFAIYQGMAVNFLYALFRTITGILYSSVWFISLAAYHFLLGGMRAYLIYAFRRRDAENAAYESDCYRKIAWLLFLLNIPMGGMIWLMIRTDSGFSYPGYVIYLSAIYTFYTMGMSVYHLSKYRKLGSPILSAAKILNFVSAMMSVLGLQTAMISVFSTEGGEFRRMMNIVTGSFVYVAVVVIALFMIITAAKKKRTVPKGEQGGKQIL